MENMASVFCYFCAKRILGSAVTSMNITLMNDNIALSEQTHQRESFASPLDLFHASV